ncbi:rhodanese-like domain-containing protein [Salarchaeum sp. JOR-1]|uniref:rhodanese-like domain-containing protein n=1 Tax=Salarchaeum sp. JOR-1 TaxID=2599399 RepID=UPI001198BBAC|nr:rhodanese-like domain-containing protein [Salarchaeum sp. JOR-1]QDX40029.1 rhodanese-like domain-containing protein [Salarchaeum sp. JOR-1]
MDGEIEPDELQSRLDDDITVVDIRNSLAFDHGHIPGSENIPFNQLPQRVDALDGANHVVTVCPHGKSSVQAANLINSYEGIGDDTPVESLAGGLDAWDGPLDSNTEEPDADEGPQSPF